MSTRLCHLVALTVVGLGLLWLVNAELRTLARQVERDPRSVTWREIWNVVAMGLATMLILSMLLWVDP